MTREEQIEDAADAFSRSKIVAGDINFIKEECFRQGAEWADFNRWVKVEDGLPSKNGHYIAMCLEPYKEPGLIYYNKDTGWGNGFYSCSHWMPLPEPPKAEQ